jgi:hypothetical protein
MGKNKQPCAKRIQQIAVIVIFQNWSFAATLTGVVNAAVYDIDELTVRGRLYGSHCSPF